MSLSKDNNMDMCNGTTTRSKRKLSESYELRCSQRQVKKKPVSKKEEENVKHRRKCEKAGCLAQIPICFANVTERCAKNGYTSRWYHISSGEHFCNECFEFYYRTYKDGYSSFLDWKKQWITNAKTEPSLKAFMADTMLPFWVQCNHPKCGKWRQLAKNKQLTKDYIEKFECSMSSTKNKKYSIPCAVPQDLRAVQAQEMNWIESLIQPPYLRNSPAAPFLGAYYPDGVGMSPTCSSCIRANNLQNEISQQNGKISSAKEEITEDTKHPDDHIKRPTIPGLNPKFHPFYQPSEHGKAMCFRPDVMEPDEVQEFKEYSKEQVMYLGIRNLIVALWNLNCKKWLTIQDVAPHLICRGLVRIRCIQETKRILIFLTQKGIINFGILDPPSNFSIVPTSYKGNIVIIGAGASGIIAAKQLTNFGFRVTVLEARNRIGGRCWDDHLLGTCVGRGAQIITGVINNPLTFMCEQDNLKIRCIGDKCDLYNSSGKTTECEIDQNVEFHFNSMLEEVANWRKNNVNDKDKSLYSKLTEMHNTFIEETDIEFSYEKKGLFNFHISNLEYACGADLDKVSAQHWDQNENFSQFAGEHAILLEGYHNLLMRLSKNLNIRLDVEVSSIDYTNADIIITTSTEEKITASKILVTIPLALLQKEYIEFIPSLSKKKIEALNCLGAGIIEKIALQFPYRFWDKKIKDDDCFGFVQDEPKKRGQCAVFYDLGVQFKKKKNGPHILMTYFTGDAVKFCDENSDEEVVNLCMKILRKIFCEKDDEIPDPINYFVTHWKEDQFSQMVYSYIKVDGTGEAYDRLAEDINQKIYFAGEATNRQFPQTVTGAIMSGLREANKILNHVKQESLTL